MTSWNPRIRDKGREPAIGVLKGHGIRCPECGSGHRLVTDSRPTMSGSIRRRSRCLGCEARFTTFESVVVGGTDVEIVDTRIPGWSDLTWEDRAFVKRMVAAIAGRRDVPEEPMPDTTETR